ncbi:MAG: purine-nucleoside phosphorylase [Gammaproteobacteria bacterium]|nr:purine-nucleoside phosphorylase [Gammaproteobacteria bacterium]
MTAAAKQAAEKIRQQIKDFIPEIIIVLGSGLGALAEAVEDAIVIPYDELPGFPSCGVKGHGGKLYFGHLNGKPVACMQGRAHFYEGISNEILLTPIRTLFLLGAKTLLATNSAGSLRAEVTPGNLVLITDHINMQFNNPLIGFQDDTFGPRFVGLEDAYDPALRKQIKIAADELNLPINEGVYIAVLGPSFETPAEINAYRTLGADVVGMSTISEIITARHCGLRAAAISVITNLAAGMHPENLSHEVTLQGAAIGTKNLIPLVKKFIAQYH